MRNYSPFYDEDSINEVRILNLYMVFIKIINQSKAWNPKYDMTFLIKEFIDGKIDFDYSASLLLYY